MPTGAILIAAGFCVIFGATLGITLVVTGAATLLAGIWTTKVVVKRYGIH